MHEDPKKLGAPHNDDSDDGSGRKLSLPAVVAVLAAIAVIAAIATIPSRAALIAFLFGAAAIAAGVLAWLLSGRKRGISLGAAGMLLAVFFIVLLIN